jgi:putative inorganic carbon (hco3(-)) transporter
VRAYDAIPEGVDAPRDATHFVLPEPRWSLAFFALLGYMLVEYSQLDQMYPILRPLHLGLSAIVLCTVGLLVSRRLPGDKPSASQGVDFMLLVFLLASFLSALFAAYPTEAWIAFSDSFRWVVIYFLISRIPGTSWRLRIFVFLLLLLNLKLAQFSIRDYFSQQSFGRSEQFLSVHGASAGSTNFFGNPGDFGVAMCVVWPIAGCLFFGERNKILRAVFLACFVAFFGAILFCGSRGALVGAAASALVAWGRNPQRIGGVVMILFLALGAYYVLPEANQERMRSALHWQTDETGRLRIQLWKAGLGMFQAHPILGVGPGNFALTYWEYNQRPDPNTRQTYWAPHSIYVQALSEVGLAGSVPLLLVLLFVARLNARTRRHILTLQPNNRQSFEYRLSLGLNLALVGYLVSGAFLTVLFYPHLWFILGLSVALHAACLRKQPEISPAELSSQEHKFALAAS